MILQGRKKDSKLLRRTVVKSWAVVICKSLLEVYHVDYCKVSILLPRIMAAHMLFHYQNVLACCIVGTAYVLRLVMLNCIEL